MKAFSILGSVILVLIVLGVPLLVSPVHASAILPNNNNNNNPSPPPSDNSNQQPSSTQSMTHDNYWTTIKSSDMNGTTTSCFSTGNATGCDKMEEFGGDLANTIFKINKYSTNGHVLEKIPDTLLTYPIPIPGYTNPFTYLHNSGTYIVCSNLSPICTTYIVFKNGTTAADLNGTGWSRTIIRNRE